MVHLFSSLISRFVGVLSRSGVIRAAAAAVSGDAPSFLAFLLRFFVEGCNSSPQWCGAAIDRHLFFSFSSASALAWAVRLNL